MAGLVWAGSAAAKASWTRAETKHFIFYSSGKPAELEDFAIETEKFDAMLRLRFNIPQDEIVNRLTIYVLPHGEDVATLKGVPKSGLEGFYQASAEGSFAVTNRDKPAGQYDGSGQQVLFHEYTHHFFARYLPNAYPVWLFEGFAEYYSTTTFKKDGTFTVGSPVWNRAYGLVEGKPMPIRDVLFKGLEGLDRAQTDIFYGRSWLLTHKLMSSPEGLKTLDSYIADLGHGLDPKEAAQKDFGDLDALDQAVEKEERTGLPMFVSKLPISFDPGYSAVELDDAQSRLVELQLQRRAQDDKHGALEGLRALAADYPDRPEILFELAEAEYEVARHGEEEAEKTGLAAADAAIDRVLALDPKHVRANILKAQVMLDRKGPDATDDDFAASRKYLVKANRADPNDPLPLYLYYRSYADIGVKPPAIALDGLSQSFERAKEVVDFRVALAFALAGEGRFDEAIQLTGFLVNDPHGAAQGRQIMDELLQMKQNFAKHEVDPADDADAPGGKEVTGKAG
ncbi:MAG: hypothetical protein J7496_09280 [Novosphingobium sp.]|nr:hypothetical protein [Novosphingobium sp.]